MPEGVARPAGRGIKSDKGDHQAQEPENQTLDDILAAQSRNEGNTQNGEKEKFGGAEREDDRFEHRQQQPQKNRSQHAADAGGPETRSQCPSALSISGHLITVEHDGRGGSIARNAEENGWDRPASVNHGVHGQEQNRPGDGVHAKHERDQQDYSKLSPKARHGTKERPERHRDQHQQNEIRIGQQVN